MLNVQTATTAQLVAFYNEHANKPVTKFADRKTAERRVTELMAAIKFSKPSPKKAAALGNTKVTSPGLRNPGDVFGSALTAAKLSPKKAATKAPAPTNTERGAAIAASWQDKSVAAARATRHAVRVTTPNGGQGNYKSVREAFVTLALPLGQHIRFRGALKAAGVAEIAGHKFQLV